MSTSRDCSTEKPAAFEPLATLPTISPAFTCDTSTPYSRLLLRKLPSTFQFVAQYTEMPDRLKLSTVKRFTTVPVIPKAPSLAHFFFVTPALPTAMPTVWPGRGVNRTVPPRRVSAIKRTWSVEITSAQFAVGSAGHGRPASV